MHPRRYVRRYILINVALAADRFNFPSVEKRKCHLCFLSLAKCPFVASSTMFFRAPHPSEDLAFERRLDIPINQWTTWFLIISIEHWKLSKNTGSRPCRTSGIAMTPRDPQCWRWLCRITWGNSRKFYMMFEQYYFGKCQNLKNRKCWKRRVQEILKVRLIRSRKSWIWDQHLSKQM